MCVCVGGGFNFCILGILQRERQLKSANTLPYKERESSETKMIVDVVKEDQKTENVRNERLFNQTGQDYMRFFEGFPFH